LDASQLEAIAFALQSDRPVTLIHGPPGTGYVKPQNLGHSEWYCQCISPLTLLILLLPFSPLFCCCVYILQPPVLYVGSCSKTTTIAELIRQAVHVHGLKVLVTAPSNVAVDNILERLITISSASTSSSRRSTTTKLPPLNAVRLGHPARLKASILPYSLEALVQSSEGTEIVQDVRKELQYFLKVLSNPHSKSTDKRLAYRELKGLRTELRTREERVVQELLSKAKVVLATTVGAANDRILNPLCRPATTTGGSGNSDDKVGFDLVIIDEAAQALEASCWIPIFRGKRVVLAGDHCQLPPTIKSHSVQAQLGLGKTMFERVLQLYGDDYQLDKNTAVTDTKSPRPPPRVSRMLKVQYRMHQDIANWASQAMYQGQLLTHESVKDRTLKQLLAVLKGSEGSLAIQFDHSDGVTTPLDQTTMLLIDTAGCDMHETLTAAGSRLNQGEAEIVAIHVRRLLELGIPQREVAIITPYNGQVELLRSLLLVEFPQLEIRSVDGFQGGEREAVVLSLVRSSDPSSSRGGVSGGGIGFLKDDRRQNVAVTRAKRHLAVICDSDTVSQSKFIQSLLLWIETHGEQRSAMEFLAEKELESDFRHAQTELLKMVEASLAVHDGDNAKPQPEAAELSKKPKTAEEQMLEDSQRKSLLDEIARFSETAPLGQEMALSSELSSFDRRVIHEFAEQNGLGHRSEGEGSHRRIILTILKKVEPVLVTLPTGALTPEKEHPREVEEDHYGRPTHVAPSFAVLLDGSSSSSDGDDDDDDTSDAEQGKERAEVVVRNSANPTLPSSANQMLADLARERAEREKAKHASVAALATATKGGKQQKAPKPSQKLGRGSVAKQQPPPVVVDKSLDTLDDMAFLDAQISVAQNAHGRTVVGKGKNYRTVVNGILNTKPLEVPLSSSSKNPKASAALRTKLQQAQEGRKVKPTKKKK
jgi:superfamily I DNA and/or RNA helicase